MCEWSDLAADDIDLAAILAGGQGHQLSPFHLLSVPGISARDQRACSELWTRERRAAALVERGTLAFTFPPSERRKIRLGYLSNDFQEHATAHLLIEVLEAHDRGAFEVHAYSFGADDGLPMRRRLMAACDRFVDITEMADGAAAQLIFDDEVDILIDLKGFTARARTGIALLRPAPVVVNYLGYPGTMGAGVCDYVITDPFLTPPASAESYAESFAYMPHTYHPHGRGTPVGVPPSRAEAGLPEAGFVFCCFNQPYKIAPEMFDIWCRLLSAVPDSVLWLLDDAYAAGNLRSEAIRRGIDARRLVFSPNVSQAEHLRRLQLADLVLDTSPFNAHTTASDALWAGVPLVTCPGDTFPSRVAGSILRAIGLADLVTESPEAYMELARALACDEPRLAAIRMRLARNRMTAPLFDVAAYTADLEGLYSAMSARHRARLPPAAIGARG
ncbi:UDP-N-acetylglucosamine-peptide N-acetylglucosaminyltransferase [Xanthobacter dioxanivorans]|uniref:UDP-N-acetylglucosamine-peptide N-acetylglucosaminyltransferase n=1 Tax=Xanthobacter dioxanivorans TaxID=2528964 RepID=A0A974SLP3_9HYPH|nr:UDP-N-acetylglucosamine-peptide N-acetylglucosaminyltransferase [Xanthobacter dioxanivorans]